MLRPDESDLWRSRYEGTITGKDKTDIRRVFCYCNADVRVPSLVDYINNIQVLFMSVSRINLHFRKSSSTVLSAVSQASANHVNDPKRYQTNLYIDFRLFDGACSF